MDDSRRSADRDLEQARAAIERGEMRHAAAHLAGALAHAPTLPEAHEMLSHLAARAGGALDLFPLEQHAPVGAVVARAHLLAAAGRPEDGLPLLFAASGHTPGRDWAGVPWVTDPTLGLRVEPDLLARNVMRLCTSIGDPEPEAAGEVLRPYLTVVTHAIAVHPAHALLLGAGSALARRAGEVTLAVDWALRGARARPSKLAEIWLGYAYRSAGRVGEALAALRRAVAHDPDDLSVYADIAGTLADAGRMDDALAWIDRALAKDPTFDCAVHTAHRLRYRADGDLEHLVRLADFARDHPDDTHEHTDLAECCSVTPWLSGVPPITRELPDQRRRPPTTAAPTATSVERLLRVARQTWPHPPAAYDAAVSLVLVEPDQLIALVADPPEGPEADRRAARVWACIGLLHHGADEPWMVSTRRRRLIDLAMGGADAITEAAMFAMVTYAWVEPEARADVRALITGRLMGIAAPRGKDGRKEGRTDSGEADDRRDKPPLAASPIACSVAQLALATPGLRAEARDLATEVVAAEEARTRPRIPRQRQRRTRPVRRQLLRWLTR
ncbi:tetratricopeptide repeat protein [Actinoplanes sp. NPDC051633]|uniref:tetratricopeptide repeat protein n=1 Tax=Actinoplanes sp. NPDC051633 TaxID=3155670 RepID=UPI0034447987